MRLGITIDNPATVVEDAQQAEKLGFDFVGCGEHLFFHGPTPNAFAMLAAAAGATSRIRLVSSIALLPLYPAPLVAKLAAVIDTISHGRFELGVGAGGEYPPEFVAAGIDPAQLGRGLEGVRAAATANGRAASAVSATLFVWTCVDEDAQWARDTGISVVSAVYKQDFSALADRYLLLGDPASVSARISEFASAGAESVLFQIAGRDRADRARIIETIAGSVIPVLTART